MQADATLREWRLRLEAPANRQILAGRFNAPSISVEETKGAAFLSSTAYLYSPRPCIPESLTKISRVATFRDNQPALPGN